MKRKIQMENLGAVLLRTVPMIIVIVLLAFSIYTQQVATEKMLMFKILKIK